jgi:hypothetical protein
MPQTQTMTVDEKPVIMFKTIKERAADNYTESRKINK